jgi:hypothetical protein
MENIQLYHKGRSCVYSSAARSLDVLDCHKNKISNVSLASEFSTLADNSGGQRLDADSWLPSAAPHYQLSKDIKDYVIVPVPAIMSDIPNTNGVAMAKQELLAFRPDSGRPSFKTWKGKPCFREHANQDISQAKGVILDSYCSPVRGYGKGLVKVMMLAAYDRTKDPVLCNQILAGEENAYSMGAYFENYLCSVCASSKGRCKHTDPRAPLKIDPVSKTLAYRNITGIEGFELSSVVSPAYIVAVSDYILGVR